MCNITIEKPLHCEQLYMHANLQHKQVGGFFI